MATAAEPRHVVAVPYPGRGHINPMLVVCRLLAAADAAFSVTVVVTEEWHALLDAAGVPATLPERVRLATIPNVIPSERGRGADLVGFIEAVQASIGEPVERLLDRVTLERKPDAIVVDTCLAWGAAAGAARGIPVCSLWTMPATFFLALCHMDRWPMADGREGEEGESCKSLDQYFPFPALSSVKYSDMKILRSRELTVKQAARMFSNVRETQCVLFTSFSELEAGAINGTSKVIPCPIYTVGPSIPHMLLEGDSHQIHREKYFDWLDAQPSNSVMYISFGSFISMPSSQLEEVALGLHDSTTRFFWVARDRATTVTLQQISGDKGLVVPWCDQLKVLCHHSIGGFLSHCGWNSTLEAVFAGVPILAFPIGWDQLVNGRLVADEWKIGINLWEHRRQDGVVSRAAISAGVTKLMDLGDGDSLGMRRKATELRDASRSAIQEGGSSWCSLNNFVQDIIEGNLNVAVVDDGRKLTLRCATKYSIKYRGRRRCEKDSIVLYPPSRTPMAPCEPAAAAAPVAGPCGLVVDGRGSGILSTTGLLESRRTQESHTTRTRRQARMAAAAGEPRGYGCHIVAVPFPGRGHVNAVMNLSRLLAARGAAVTFVVTEEWLGLLRSSSPAAAAEPAGIRLRTIPNVIPSEHGRAADHSGFLDAVATEMEAPFERLLDELEGPPPAALVADAYVPWVVGVGNRRGVPVWSLFPMSAAFFFAYYHFDRLPAWLTDHEHAPDSGNSDQRLGRYIAEQASSSIRLSNLEPLIHNKRAVKHVLATISSAINAQCLLFTTMYELEVSVIDSLRSVLACPVYPIGPCIPYMTLEDHHTMSNAEVSSQSDWSSWLDSQPVNSVLYVSLGSFVSVSASQLDEIALGLAASEVRFLWILREKSPLVQELFASTDKGVILPWCEQLKVLCHRSVGGFLTHCGMNSTLEAIFAGVPMLALPLFFDQPIDCQLIVEEWKVGLNLRDWASKDGLIGREDIARAAKRLMSSDDTETKAIRGRALEWKEASRRAVDKGGSSYQNLSSLMEMICTSE